jgi:hypothetical protein
VLKQIYGNRCMSSGGEISIIVNSNLGRQRMKQVIAVSALACEHNTTLKLH